jgi:uncharacterized membrane protein YqjE
MKQEQPQITPGAPAPAASREHGDESITDLIRNLATDLSSLLSKEMELAKAELGESVSEAKTAVGSMVTGAVVTMAGLVVLLMSAVYGLSNVVAPWLAALIVGAVALLIGYMMVAAARKKMSANSFVPDRTLESAHKDKETLQRATR